MASSSTGDSAPAARLAKLLDACPSALLVFDDRTTLAMSKELLMLQSPVLPGAIIFAYKEQCVSQVRVALPGDRRADWVTALPFLYGVECEVTWDTAGTLAGLLQKYELSALRTALGRFLLLEAEAVWRMGSDDGTSPRCAWSWLVITANCRLEESEVLRMCKLVADKRLNVPACFDLGLRSEVARCASA